MEETATKRAHRKSLIPFDIKEWAISLRILRSSPASAVGAVIAVTFVVISLLVWATGGKILPFNPLAVDTSQILTPPSFTHLLGTDDLGRDILSRVLAAAPVDASVSFLVVATAVTLGLLTGSLVGYVGGALEEVVMRITDIFLAFPGIILALAIVAALGPSLIHTVYALIPVWWPSYTRLARGESLQLKSQQFIEASRSVGHRSRYIVLHHIVPNVVPVLLVYATLDIGNVILTFSVLSFIGLGAQPPASEWGLMTIQGESYLGSSPWYPVAPALVILIVAIGFSLLGDGLRDTLDPRIRGLFG